MQTNVVLYRINFCTNYCTRVTNSQLGITAQISQLRNVGIAEAG